jgi:ribose-phosphate pyrophosphokinase
MVLIGGLANPALAQSIAKILDTKVHFPTTKFADGEMCVKIPVNITNKFVFIIQPTCKPVNDNIMELLLICDAAKRGGAKEVIAVIPYYGYSRQDRKDQPRVPISSALVASALKSAGATRIITLDIHSEQQQGFFNGPWDNLYASYASVPILQKVAHKNAVIVSPDKGGVPRAKAYAQLLDTNDVAVVFKERDTKTKNQSKALFLVGDVKGKTAVIVDDLIDTAGTMANAAEMLKKEGANKIIVVATHGLFSGNALENISSPAIHSVYCTDTLPLDENVLKNKKIKVVSVAPLLAEAIEKTFKGESLSKDLIL